MNLTGFLFERPDTGWQWALYRNFHTPQRCLLGFGQAETISTASVLLEACRRAAEKLPPHATGLLDFGAHLTLDYLMTGDTDADRNLF